MDLVQLGPTGTLEKQLYWNLLSHISRAPTPPPLSLFSIQYDLATGSSLQDYLLLKCYALLDTVDYFHVM